MTCWSACRYCLPNGDSGIIRTLDAPVYITRVFGNIIYCLDRDGKNRQIQARLLFYSHCGALLLSVTPAGLVKHVTGWKYNMRGHTTKRVHTCLMMRCCATHVAAQA